MRTREEQACRDTELDVLEESIQLLKRQEMLLCKGSNTVWKIVYHARMHLESKMYDAIKEGM